MVQGVKFLVVLLMAWVQRLFQPVYGLVVHLIYFCNICYGNRVLHGLPLIYKNTAYSTSEKCGLSLLNTFSPTKPTHRVTAQKYSVCLGFSQNPLPKSILSRYPVIT